MKSTGSILDVVIALISIGAGIYLLQFQSAGESSWFEVIGHGMGAYFIAKGLFMGRSLAQQTRTSDRLAQLVEFEAVRYERETGDNWRGLDDDAVEDGVTA